MTFIRKNPFYNNNIIIERIYKESVISSQYSCTKLIHIHTVLMYYMICRRVVTTGVVSTGGYSGHTPSPHGGQIVYTIQHVYNNMNNEYIMCILNMYIKFFIFPS